MAINPPNGNKEVVVLAGSWLPITAPFDCDYMAIPNPDQAINLKLRTDSTDPATQEIIAPGAQKLYTSTPRVRPRFRKDVTICFLQAESGSITLTVNHLE